jgi:hypothetical protein
MNTAVIAAATSGRLSFASTFVAVRLRRAASERKEALERQLQEFVLELLAAVVLIAIFMLVTGPTAREEA